MKKILTLFSVTFILVLVISMPVYASSYKTVTGVKTKYGSSYVWRASNSSFYVQYSGSTYSISKPAYTLSGVTNGSILYYSSLEGKRSGKVTLYKYNIKTRKEQKIGTIKKALHIEGFYNNCVYGNGVNSDGRASDVVYRYNLKTKKKSTVLSNCWIEKASGKYLYVTRDGVKYRYNIPKKKLTKYNWSY